MGLLSRLSWTLLLLFALGESDSRRRGGLSKDKKGKFCEFRFDFKLCEVGKMFLACFFQSTSSKSSGKCKKVEFGLKKTLPLKNVKNLMDSTYTKC